MQPLLETQAPPWRITSLASLHEVLRFVAPVFAQRTAVRDEREQLGYAALLDGARRVAVALQHQGLAAGARVALFAPKSVGYVQALMGINALNAAFVPVNPQLKPAQLQHILRDSGAELLVGTRERLAALAPEVVHGVRTLALDELLAAAAALPEEAADAPLALPCDGDIGAILYTSGSTGMPKGVVLTQRNLVAGALSVASYLGLEPSDVVLGVLPLSFDAGLSQLGTSLVSGACYVPWEFVHASQLPRACERLGVTSITAVPPLWHLIAEAPWGAEAAQVKRIANTGGHMNRELLARLRGCFPQARPFLMYGLTESFRSTFLDPDELERRPDSIGKAVPNAEIAVVRPDGSECAPGEPGELVHRGAFVTLGYLNSPERSADRFKPWPRPPRGVARQELAVWSGDTVRRDAEGFLYFIGRNDEMIKSSGQRVSPTEIETVLLACPGIARAAVVGLPDERLGQLIAACVEWNADTAADTDRLLAHCRRELPGWMVPRAVECFDALPLNPNGKLDRPRIRGLCEERRGLARAAEAGA